MQKEANKGCRGRRKKRKHVMNMETSSLYFGPLAKDFGTIPRLMKRRSAHGQKRTYKHVQAQTHIHLFTDTWGAMNKKSFDSITKILRHLLI